MTRPGLLALSVSLLLVGVAAAATVVDAGVTQLTADSAVPQPVAISAQGDGELTGFNLRAQIGDGLGPGDEPLFDAVDFSGGIWEAHPYQTFGGPVGTLLQLAQASVVFDAPGDSVVPGTTSLVATPSVTTSGITEGVFDLNLSDPPDIGQGSDFIAVGGGPVPDVWFNDGKLFIVGPSTLLWSGGAGNWADASWDNGSGNVSPSGGEAVVLTSGSVTVGDSRTASSVTLGGGDLSVDGAGQLQVAGQVYVGQTSGLNVNGTLNLTSGDVFVAAGYPDGSTAGGTVSGSGTIQGSATQAGTVAPGNSIGTLTFTGDVTFGSGSVYEVELTGNDTDGTTANDLLAVTGTLDLSVTGERMTLDWLPGADATSMFGGDYVVATAGTLVGEFDPNDVGGGNIGDDYIQNVSYAGDEVTVTLYDQLPGDANLDGSVSLIDLSALGAHWLETGADWFEGDFNFDGQVSLVDLSVLGSYWLDTVGGGGGGMTLPANAVPEPGTLLLVLSGLFGIGIMALVRGRRRSGK